MPIAFPWTTLSFMTFIISFLTNGAFMAIQAQELVDLLPGCEQYDNFQEVAQCFIEYSHPTCFNQTTPANLAQCFNDELPPDNFGIRNMTVVADTVVETAVDCFAPYTDCVNETIQEALGDLPPCVETTTTALFQCYIDNAEACAASCLAEGGWDSPYQDLNPTDLVGCQSIESNVIHPACEGLSCCPQCLDDFERVSECIVNDVLSATLRPCDFECDDAPGLNRRRIQEGTTTSNAGLVNANVTAEELWNKCGTMTPGIMGLDQPYRQLVVRSKFFTCLVDQAIGLYGEQVEYDSPTSSPTQASNGIAWTRNLYLIAVGITMESTLLAWL